MPFPLIQIILNMDKHRTCIALMPSTDWQKGSVSVSSYKNQISSWTPFQNATKINCTVQGLRKDENCRNLQGKKTKHEGALTWKHEQLTGSKPSSCKACQLGPGPPSLCCQWLPSYSHCLTPNLQCIVPAWMRSAAEKVGHLLKKVMHIETG